MTGPRHWKPWTQAEQLDLQRMVSLGRSYQDVAERLGRTRDAVRVRVHKLRAANRRRRRALESRRKQAHCTEPLGELASCDPERPEATEWHGGHREW